MRQRLTTIKELKFYAKHIWWVFQYLHFFLCIYSTTLLLNHLNTFKNYWQCSLTQIIQATTRYLIYLSRRSPTTQQIFPVGVERQQPSCGKLLVACGIQTGVVRHRARPQCDLTEFLPLTVHTPFTQLLHRCLKHYYLFYSTKVLLWWFIMPNYFKIRPHMITVRFREDITTVRMYLT